MEFQNEDPAKVSMHLWAASCPRIIFTPKPAEQGGHYLMAHFDDLRLCIETGANNDAVSLMELRFSGEVPGEIAFGGEANASDRISLLESDGWVFDLYLDLGKAVVAQIEPSGRFLVRPGMAFEAPADQDRLDLKEVGLVMQKARTLRSAKRSIRRIPRKAKDGKRVQRYELGSNAIELVMRTTLFKQNLYLAAGLGGIVPIVFDGMVNIDQMDENLARTLRSAIPKIP